MNGIFPNKIFVKSVSVDVTKKCNLSCGFCYLTGLKEKGISVYDNSEDFFRLIYLKN
jgi:MoaA/NifB/PqqE/SkfB family radical SAM enzyme